MAHPRVSILTQTKLSKKRGEGGKGGKGRRKREKGKNEKNMGDVVRFVALNVAKRQISGGRF